MPKISIRGNTLYYRELKHTEVVGSVDGQGTLWLKDIPNRETLWSEGRYVRPAGQEDRQYVRGGRRRSGSSGGRPVDSLTSIPTSKGVQREQLSGQLKGEA